MHINRVILTGNLTSDPELRTLPSGTSLCKLRVAVNTRKKDGASGEWVDKPNFFDVTVWGKQGENAAKYLAKGRPVAIDGKLEWREWETPEGQKRQAVDIVVGMDGAIQFLGSGNNGGNGNGNASNGGGDFSAPAPAGDFGGGAPAGDDDIPF